MFFLLVGVIDDIIASLIFYLKLLFCLASVKIHQIFLRSFQILFQQLKGCPFNYKEHFHFKKYFTLRM